MVQAYLRKIKTFFNQQGSRPDARLGWGLAALLTGKYREAVRVLQPLSASRSLPANYALGLALDKLGRWPESIVAFRRHLRLYPHDAAAWIRLGLGLDRLGHYPEAAEAFWAAGHWAPGKAFPHIRQGLSLHRAGRYAEAAQAFKSAAFLRPHDGRIYFYLAETLEVGGRLRQAAAAYQRALSCRPGSVPARMRLAAVFVKQGDFQPARRALEAVSRQRPRDPHILASLGLVREALGHFRAALRLYQQAQRQCPGLPGLSFCIGRVFYNLGLWRQAILAFRQVIAERPHDGPAWLYLGGALARLRRFPEAMAGYAHAAAGQPAQPQARYYWGQILLVLENREAARQQLLALRRAPSPLAARLFDSLYHLQDKQWPACYRLVMNEAARKQQAYHTVVVWCGSTLLAAVTLTLGWALGLPGLGLPVFPGVAGLLGLALLAALRPAFRPSDFNRRLELNLAEKMRGQVWRYITQSKPYASRYSPFANRQRFLNYLLVLARQYRSVARGGLATHCRQAESQPQISEHMMEIRNLPPADRAQSYAAMRLQTALHPADLLTEPASAAVWRNLALWLLAGGLLILCAWFWSPAIWGSLACQAIFFVQLVRMHQARPLASPLAAERLTHLILRAETIKSESDLTAWVQESERLLSAAAHRWRTALHKDGHRSFTPGPKPPRSAPR